MSQVQFINLDDRVQNSGKVCWEDRQGFGGQQTQATRYDPW